MKIKRMNLAAVNTAIETASNNGNIAFEGNQMVPRSVSAYHLLLRLTELGEGNRVSPKIKDWPDGHHKERTYVAPLPPPRFRKFPKQHKKAA